MVSSIVYHTNQEFKNATRLHQAGLEAFSNIAAYQAEVTKKTPLAPYFRFMAAIFETSARVHKDYPRPEFGLDKIEINRKIYDIVEEDVLDKAFCRLKHFKRLNPDGSDIKRNDPKILLFAPMSGHFSTLLRDTVRKLLPHHDVYITDWKDAKNVPLSKGKFDLSDYVEYSKEFMQFLGKNTHVMAVCQPTVPVIAAIALLAKDKKAIQPLSMTYMGGPLHPSANITEPVKLAKEKPMKFFEDLIVHISRHYPGAGRRAYSGMFQLMGFKMMNQRLHQESDAKFFQHLMAGDEELAQKYREFYNEYNAVSDMSADFYLDTIKHFKYEDIVHGKMVINGQRVDLSKIRKTALFTIEGTKDDISAPGQTIAAHRLCTGIPKSMKFALLQEGAGHYGVFSGSKWRDSILPQYEEFTRLIGQNHGLEYTPIILKGSPPLKIQSGNNLKTWAQALKTDYKNYFTSQEVACMPKLVPA